MNKEAYIEPFRIEPLQDWSSYINSCGLKY